MLKRIKLLFESKEILEAMNEELIEDCFEKDKTINQLEELIAYLKNEIIIKNDKIDKLLETNRGLEEKIKKAKTTKTTKIRQATKVEEVKEEPKKRGRRVCKNLD